MLASYPHSRATSSTAAIYGGNRRRGGAIAHRDGGIIHGGGRIGRTGGYLGPSLRRLTPQVVAQAGRPHCHLSGPAAQERVTTTSKRAHRPTRAQSGARAQNHGVNVQTLPTRRREQMPPPSIPTFPHQKAKKSRYQQHAVSYNPITRLGCDSCSIGQHKTPTQREGGLQDVTSACRPQVDYYEALFRQVSRSSSNSSRCQVSVSARVLFLGIFLHAHQATQDHAYKDRGV